MTEPLDWARVPIASFDDPHLRRRIKTWGRMNEEQGRHVTITRSVQTNEMVLEAWDDLQERSIVATSLDDFPDLETQLRNIRATAHTWRVASIRDALGVPAIFAAVNLVSSLTGSMSMKAMRGQVEVPPDERPRIIVRPDPFTIPREFYRSTAYNLATRGEAWWWIAARDSDDMALSVISVAPNEVIVEEDPRDLRFPIIKWRDKVMRNEDFRQLVYAREPGALRGHGPLQMCGAAVSVSVEAQEWAANLYSGGGVPSITIKSAVPLTKVEAETLRTEWMDKPANVPRIIDPGIDEIKEFGASSSGGSMLESRDHQNVDAATMFNINASLLNAAVSGSSLTYQNVSSQFEELLRECLRPNYLEVIEQTMSDLLPRQTVARFNTDSLTLADIKTRYEVYGLGIDKGIIDAEESRRFEGLAPGDVENAAVPFSPPQAIPASLPVQMRSEEVRCDGMRVLRGVLRPCGKLLAEQGPFVGSCPRCKKTYEAVEVRSEPLVAPVIPIRVRQVKPTKAEPVAPEPPSEMAMIRELIQALPGAIAAANPRQEVPQPPTLHVHEGAIRSEVHLSSARKRVERDGTGYVITEEHA